MQANVKKAKQLKEIDDRDHDPPDTFTSMVSKNLISYDDLDDFIRNFSEMTELNYIRIPSALQRLHQIVHTLQMMNMNMFTNL